MTNYDEIQRAKSAAMQHESHYGQPEPLTARERIQVWAVAILVATALIGGAIGVLYFAANS